MGLAGVLLKEIADVIARLFSINFERSWGSATSLMTVKGINVTPILKKGKKEYLGIYRLCQLLFNPQDDWPCKQRESNGCCLL